MPAFVVVEKTGSLKAQKATSINELYKKCGFKTADGFACVHSWTIEFNEVEYKLSIFGKTDGRANTENKFEFPPPIDNVLFFGNCAAVLSTENGAASDMTPEEFTDIIDNLNGGYSDIGSEDSEDEDDDEEDIGLPKTKHGYVKDDFVVSSDAEDEDSFEDFDEEEEEELDDDDDIKAKNKKSLKKSEEQVVVVVTAAEKTKKKAVSKPKKPKLREEPELTVCSEELTEDPYL
jgi:hypothetical protein